MIWGKIDSDFSVQLFYDFKKFVKIEIRRPAPDLLQYFVWRTASHIVMYRLFCFVLFFSWFLVLKASTEHTGSILCYCNYALRLGKRLIEIVWSLSWRYRLSWSIALPPCGYWRSFLEGACLLSYWYSQPFSFKLHECYFVEKVEGLL